MTGIAITDARGELADLVNRAAYGGERVVLTRRGRPIAAIISADDLAFFEALEDANDARAVDASLAEAVPTTSLGEVKARLGL